MNLPPGVVAYFERLGTHVVAEDALTNGAVNEVRRLRAANGRTAVLKQGPNPPADLYAIEAEGLGALRVPGGPLTPEVYGVAADYLLLEDLGGHDDPPVGYWERFGRELAALHQHTSPRFGFGHDNYLGLLLIDNTWSEDGAEFFARTRILRFLDVPLCDETLSREERRAVESIAARLPELVPPQPAALLHGDLWWANMLVGPNGAPAMIDPAAYYGWAEAELAMTLQTGRVPEIFFDAYREAHPLEPGWEDRLYLLGIREELSMIAHFGNRYGTLAKLQAILARFC